MANEMVNNKQVNFWRGSATPPTIYHIWIRNNSEMLLYNGTDWVVFLDSADVIESLNKMQKQIDELKLQVEGWEDHTVNSKPIKSNPVLDGKDLKIVESGTFINSNDTVTGGLLRIDKLLVTQILE